MRVQNEMFVSFFSAAFFKNIFRYDNLAVTQKMPQECVCSLHLKRSLTN